MDDAVEAAEKIADLLGHLPLALAQAAAFIRKASLSLIEYLRRLEQDLVRYVSKTYPPYKDGVFSCWKLSVQAVIELNPHAIDLLRICAFLSPDGISTELLRKGLQEMKCLNGEYRISIHLRIALHVPDNVKHPEIMSSQSFPLLPFPD